MSSVFSRKITMSTFSGCLTGEGTPLYQRTGRRQTNRSNSCRSATFSERMPPPNGVVRQPGVEPGEALLAGKHLHPDDLAAAVVRLLDGGVEHPDARAPDVGP